jgi:hypothetical protein
MTWFTEAPVIERLTFVITTCGALFATVAYLVHVLRWQMKKRRLLGYLKREKIGKDNGMRSAMNIMRELGLTQDEILHISYWSPRIGRRVRTDADNFADKLLFEYREDRT